MKSFLNRSFYLKMGLGYMVMSRPATGGYATQPTVSSVTLPVSIGNEWNLGPFDLAIDWIAANIALDKFFSPYDDTKGSSLHEFSFCNLSLGLSV